MKRKTKGTEKIRKEREGNIRVSVERQGNGMNGKQLTYTRIDTRQGRDCRGRKGAELTGKATERNGMTRALQERKGNERTWDVMKGTDRT